jgi:bifunctional ADP-heptose synthase (sugar kinase/adenylyltransferase)
MRILVIGDSCTDEFIYCDIERICPEAPVPVLKPKKSKSNPGMAANVVENLKSLGVEVDLITNSNTIIKTRYVDSRSGQMVMRVDQNDKCKKYHGETYDAIGYDAIIISDYCKGFLTESDIEMWAERAKCPVFLDTKKQLGDWCNDISFIKINEFEHKKNFERLPNYPFILDKMIVTIGSKGCKYQDKTYPVPEVSVKDVSGAGDTFLAGLVFKYLQSNNIQQAIKFANECATQIVQKRGVATL